MIDLSTLNAGQKDAVTYGAGPLLVLAGAGSGKTRVLTQRTAYLIEQGEAPETFFVSTFTKKAATEMSERLANLIGAEAIKKVQIGTFHSFCYRVLMVEGGKKLEILPDYHQKKLIKNLIAPPSKDYPDAMNWGEDLGRVISRISRAKNDLLSVDALAKLHEGDSAQSRFIQLYRLYEKYKEAQGKLDFDDMLLKCWQLFKHRPDVLARYQERFKWVLVDELQDTNLAQWELVKMLSAPHNNITGVGDVDQSIYAFRGAKPELVMAFAKMFRGAKTIILEENYRSTENIVDTANSLIKNNAARVRKTLKSMVGVGADPYYISHVTAEDEASAIVDEIQALLKEGVTGGDIATLYRCNAQSRPFEDELVKRDIPYTIIGSAGFYNRKEIRDMIAYLWAICVPSDTDRWERIINVPNRYLGKAFISTVKTHAYRAGMTFFEAMTETPGLKHFQFRAADEFTYEIRSLQKIAEEVTPAKLISEVRKRFKYDEYLIKEEGGEDGADNNRIENLNELTIAAANFSNLPEFLAFVDKQQSKSSSGTPDPDKVQLMTIHRAKGLEWPVVFLAGVSNGLLPHKNAIEYDAGGEVIPESVEEERRLAYVGITRARQTLYMSSIDSWQGRPCGPSMFLREIGIGVEEEIMEAVTHG